MKSACIVPAWNTHGKRDATGAFQPEGSRWTALHGGSYYLFDNRLTRGARREQVEGMLAKENDLDWVAIFCHGYPRGMQTGHALRQAGRLAEAIAMACKPTAIVTLFACNTARDADRDNKDDLVPGPGGEGGFADRLRDELVEKGMHGGWIDAHTVVGHTTKAPWVRRFYISEADKYDGGEYIVRPKGENWQEWVLWLRSSHEFRLSFSLCLASDINAVLSGRMQNLEKVTGGYVGQKPSKPRPT